MLVRLLRPMRGWRALVGEIGVIVTGILIALGAEYLIQQRHFEGEARQADRAIIIELRTSMRNAFERMTIQPCLRGTIAGLSNRLVASQGQWVGLPMAIKNQSQYSVVMPVAYRGPSRLWLADAWQTAVTNGVLNHLPADRVSELSAIYSQARHMNELQEQEARAAARLTLLSFDGAIDNRTRADMIISLAEVDRINSLMALISGQIIVAIAKLRPQYPGLREETDQIVQAQRLTRGQCVSAMHLNMG